MTELMRLVERLRNPSWVIPEPAAAQLVAYLDPVATRETMNEAANRIEELERRINDAIRIVDNELAKRKHGTDGPAD